MSDGTYERMNRIYRAVKEHWESFNLPPDVRWLTRRANISSTSETARLLRELVSEGRLELGETASGTRKVLRPA